MSMYTIFSGTKDELKKYLLSIFPEISLHDFDKILYGIEAICSKLSTTEDTFDVEVLSNTDERNANLDYISLYIPSIKYNINMKAAKFYLIVNFSKSMMTMMTGEQFHAPFFATVVDVIANCIRKVDETNGEACVLQEMIAPKLRSVHKDILPPKNGFCFNNQLECRFRNKDNDLCTITPCDVDSCFDFLENKGIIKRDGDVYCYDKL